MSKSNNRMPRGQEALDDDALDVVLGGASVGVYGNIGYLSPVTTGNVTVALGLQSSFPFVTGGIYTNHGDGVSTGASVGASAGLFGATGNADSYFTGPGYAASGSIDAIAKAGVEGGINSSGVSAGLNVGVGVTAFGVDGVGVQGSVMHTDGSNVFDSNGTGSTFNMNPTGTGVPTSSPGEYAGYFNASQSPALDRYEPSSPELNAAIGAINADHGNDAHADVGHDANDVSHSDPLDRSEPSSPELDQAIHGSDDTHASDSGSHATDDSGSHASDDSGSHASDDSGSHASDDSGSHASDSSGNNSSSDFGNDFGDSSYGDFGGDGGGGDFG